MVLQKGSAEPTFKWDLVSLQNLKYFLNPICPLFGRVGGAVNGSVEYISRGRGEGWFPMLCRLGVEAAHRSEVTEEGLQCECMIGPSHVSLPRMPC